jgi:chromatin segregation and condensation protein Rec8/ScpA/Scc1 (kleisin family)
VININEAKVIQTIVLGSDWQEVLTEIVTEEGMDPLSIDLIKLVDTFMIYLQKLKSFDFRIPARFILISAILLRMKCELLFEEEEKKRLEAEKVPPIDVSNVPLLIPPLLREPTRKVTLTELINALNKVMEFKERKEEKQIRLKRTVEKLIAPEEDIEAKIKRIYERIVKNHDIKFSELVPVWKRKDIVDTFLPILYLSQRGKITCEQEEFFKEIYIKIRDDVPSAVVEGAVQNG